MGGHADGRRRLSTGLGAVVVRGAGASAGRGWLRPLALNAANGANTCTGTSLPHLAISLPFLLIAHEPNGQRTENLSAKRRVRQSPPTSK